MSGRVGGRISGRMSVSANVAMGVRVSKDECDGKIRVSVKM